jgi:hypothetical protein
MTEHPKTWSSGPGQAARLGEPAPAAPRALPGRGGMNAASYPLRLEARLDGSLSRWLWLVKWLLLIPHYFVLVFLWIALFVLTVVAGFAILFTGRYPRGIFDFNVGVLRWSWRVGFYGHDALGTDRYPPFTLKDVPDYPAGLHITYPEKLSRGLVLVKWWLLAIPHYLIIGGLFGATSAYTGDDDWYQTLGLFHALLLVVAIGLLFTGRYLAGLFDFVIGINRWIARVTVYSLLMTDSYPPFRLDQGGTEPSDVIKANP